MSGGRFATRAGSGSSFRSGPRLRFTHREVALKEGLEPPDPERVRAAQSAFLRFLADRIAGDSFREEAGEPRRPDPQPPGDGRFRHPDRHR